ncbi:septum site-determining protein MinD [Coprothermobacteraceae bacterium]|nr:septum site-determining protein MinD [Coprothermobacteraceae bacterium]
MAGQCIVVTSAKGGVGKTTITGNVGFALAASGYRVLLIDGDIGLKNLDSVLGLERRVVYDLFDVVTGRVALGDALVRDKRLNDRLFLLAASQTHFKEDIPLEKFSEIVEEARESFDYVLVDSPAGIEHGFRMSTRYADKALVVTVPEVPSIRDADRVLGLLENFKVGIIGVVINRLNKTLVRQGNMLSPEDVVDLLQVPLAGVVYDDPIIVQAVNQGEPVVYKYPNTAVAKAYVNIAKKIENPDYEVAVAAEQKPRGFWNLLGFLRGDN